MAKAPDTVMNTLRPMTSLLLPVPSSANASANQNPIADHVKTGIRRSQQQTRALPRNVQRCPAMSISYKLPDQRSHRRSEILRWSDDREHVVLPEQYAAAGSAMPGNLAGHPP